jgi:hypothetical protein
MFFIPFFVNTWFSRGFDVGEWQITKDLKII